MCAGHTATLCTCADPCLLSLSQPHLQTQIRTSQSTLVSLKADLTPPLIRTHTHPIGHVGTGAPADAHAVTCTLTFTLPRASSAGQLTLPGKDLSPRRCKVKRAGGSQ